MTDEQGTSEPLISRWNGIRSQMFSERRPEDFLKHLDGCNKQSISTAESREPIETGAWKPAHFFIRTALMAGDQESSNNQPESSYSKEDEPPGRTMSRIDRIQKVLKQKQQKIMNKLTKPRVTPAGEARSEEVPRESPILRSRSSQSVKVVASPEPLPGSLLTATNLPNQMVFERDGPSLPTYRKETVVLVEATDYQRPLRPDTSSGMDSHLAEIESPSHPGVQVTPATSRQGDPPSEEGPGVIERSRLRRIESRESLKVDKDGERSKTQVQRIKEQLEKAKSEPRVEPAPTVPTAPNAEEGTKKTKVCTIL